MSLQQQQNLLARLYTDAEFRRGFLSSPEKIGAESDLSETEIAEIAAIMPEELNFFAATLFWKRLREAEKFLPLTKNVLDEDFAAKFREFSETFNPQTVKKHLEDAIYFCRFLQKRDVSEIAKTAAKFERSKLEFFGLEKRIVYCLLDFDARELSAADSVQKLENLKKKKKITVWLRIGKLVKHFII
jgi:hypothetical protein